MTDLIAEMMASERKKQQSRVMFTILEAGTWSQSEVNNLVSKLVTEVYQHPKLPKFVVLFGKHEIERIRQILGESIHLEHKIVQGVDNPELPFIPSGF